MNLSKIRVLRETRVLQEGNVLPLPAAKGNGFSNINGRGEKEGLLHQNIPNLEAPQWLQLLSVIMLESGW